MKHWIPSILFALFIFFLSSQSHLPGADMAPDYVEHFLCYGVFALTVVWGVTGGLRRRLTPKLVAAAFFITSLYGATDEFHQYFVPGRDCSLSDLLADALGGTCFILLGFLAVRLWLRRTTAAVPPESA